MLDYLDTQIDMLRKNMIAVGLTTGLSSKETILLSKRLDNLLNLQMIILRGGNAC